MKLFDKILIANRGEIAVRVIKTARMLGIKTVAIYSEIDVNSIHYNLADEFYCIGKQELSETYLNIDKIINLAKKTNCQAIHPGYGFLSENPLFAEECEKNGIIFIGPGSKIINLMGNKVEARNFIKSINIPMLSGTSGNPETLLTEIKGIPFPLLVKAAAGGGGKGMKIVRNQGELENALESASREAKNYFGDGTIFVEKFVENPRHIEVQIIGDKHGKVVHLFERECSIQRRYQKIIEESPSPTLTPEVREKICNAAVEIGEKIGYDNAGTIEFLVDSDLNFYFLEMNTRIQVEHPVTEMVTGVDIVAEQIFIASGFPIRLKQVNLSQSGHSIECRIYAEDPFNNFLPSPGEMTFYKTPSENEFRIDSGISSKTIISSSFDPMISKIITHAKTRTETIQKMKSGLENYKIQGIKTNISYLIKLLDNKNYIENNVYTKFCDANIENISNEYFTEKSKVENFIPIISYLIYCIKKSEIQKNIWQKIGFWRHNSIIKLKLDTKLFELNLIKSNLNVYEVEFENKLHKTEFINFHENELKIRINDEFITTYISDNNKGKTNLSFSIYDFELSREDYLLNQEFTGAYDNLFANDINFVSSPMPGKVIKINIIEGQEVKKGEILMIVEAMKMENHITSPKDVIIKEIKTKVGEMVETQNPLIIFE